MPVIPSSFTPPWSLWNGHVQTILPVLCKRSLVLQPERIRMELSDGDFLDLDHYQANPDKLSQRVVVLSHGLEGSSRQDYILGMAHTFLSAGWDVVAWNLRGCSGELNRLPRFYHSGETCDLHQVVNYLIARWDYENFALVGFSLGGNLTLKYAAEYAQQDGLLGSVAISAPVDLVGGAQILDARPSNRIYLRRFLKTLVQKVKVKAEKFPQSFNLDGIDRMTTFSQFDNQFTAPLHGFTDAMDYWTKSSSIHLLADLRRPALLLNAANDPFFDESCLPFEQAQALEHFYFECPPSGGHVGFFTHWQEMQRYSERRALEFLEHQCVVAPHSILN